MALIDFVLHKHNLEEAIKNFLTQENNQNLDEFYTLLNPLDDLIDRAKYVMEHLIVDFLDLRYDFIRKVWAQLRGYKDNFGDGFLMQHSSFRNSFLRQFYKFLVDVDQEASTFVCVEEVGS